MNRENLDRTNAAMIVVQCWVANYLFCSSRSVRVSKTAAQAFHCHYDIKGFELNLSSKMIVV